MPHSRLPRSGIRLRHGVATDLARMRSPCIAGDAARMLACAGARPTPSPSPISSMPSRPRRSRPGVSATSTSWRPAGLTPDPTIPDLVETQPEFTTPIWDYLDQRVSDERIADGQGGDRRRTARCSRRSASASASIRTSSARSGASRPTMARCCDNPKLHQADHPVAGDAGLSAARPATSATRPTSSRR